MRLRRHRRTDEELLRHLAYVARHKFSLTVWQWKPGHVGQHAPGSLHYLTFPHSSTGRAFDAYGTPHNMARYARWLRRWHRRRLTEAIFNGRYTRLSIKGGVTVAPWFWGATTWAEHNNHVHVGI